MKDKMKDNKFIYRFGATVMLVSIAFAGGKSLIEISTLDASATEKRPDMYLTDGDVIDPATAPVTAKFEDDTAEAFALASLEGDVTPDFNEFLSRFLCNACGKGCLLVSPSCFVGKKTQEKATVLYQEMYPDVEI